MTQRIAVIAAHPDDEALGCGGTLLKYKKYGAQIHLLFLTDGISSRQEISIEDRHERAQGLEAAIEYLKPASMVKHDFPDNQLDTVPLLQVIQTIERFINEVKPRIVFTHFENDLNIDHSIVHRAAITACRPRPNSDISKLLCFEIPSSTEWTASQNFQPNYFIDITDYMLLKQEYLRCYESELREFPHPRSLENIKALHQYRGAIVNRPYAEAFYLVRAINLDSDFL